MENLEYDHPDRKLSRDLYHDVHEGDAIRLSVGTDVRDERRVITPDHVGTETKATVELFVGDMPSDSGERAAIRAELDTWRADSEPGNDYRVGFDYLH